MREIDFFLEFLGIDIEAIVESSIVARNREMTVHHWILTLQIRFVEIVHIFHVTSSRTWKEKEASKVFYSNSDFLCRSPLEKTN